MTINKVLIVDDDENIRLLMQMSLEADWHVIAATSGTQALELARLEKPDLILLDVMMPEMDGATVLSELRKQDVTKNMPVIFITAKVQNVEMESYIKLGANGVIIKPFDPLSLVDQIKKIVNGSSQ